MKTTPLRSSISGIVPLSASSSNSTSPVNQKATTYYDALSPIASSPKNAFKGMGPLPIMRVDQPEVTPEVPESSWTASLFSPVLKLFGQENSTISSDDSTDASSEVKMTEDDSFESKTNTDNEEDEDVPEEEDTSCYEFDPFLFMAQLPPHALVRHNVQDRRPPYKRLEHRFKPTLVLDLDETLVHCSADPSGRYDVTFGVQFNGSLCQVYVRKRPHLETFLDYVSQKYEIILFTASQRVYAERLLDILDPQQKWIHHRLYRESCLMVHGNLLKDLTILDRDLQKTIIVDNSPHAFGYQLDNGIPIESWYENPHDVELLKLLPLLEVLHNVDDVRPHLRKAFKMHELVTEARYRC